MKPRIWLVRQHILISEVLTQSSWQTTREKCLAILRRQEVVDSDPRGDRAVLVWWQRNVSDSSLWITSQTHRPAQTLPHRRFHVLWHRGFSSTRRSLNKVGEDSHRKWRRLRSSSTRVTRGAADFNSWPHVSYFLLLCSVKFPETVDLTWRPCSSPEVGFSTFHATRRYGMLRLHWWSLYWLSERTSSHSFCIKWNISGYKFLVVKGSWTLLFDPVGFKIAWTWRRIYRQH